MTISYAEPTRLTCPRCGSPFDAEVWTLIDSAERPDLRDALLGDTLNLVTCPHCGERGPAGGPLLLHDLSARRVYFAVPEDVDEPIWRDHAQALLYALVGALPEETRLPYLGDVQVEWGIAGLRRALARNQRRDSGVRRREAPATPAAPVTPLESSAPPQPAAAPQAAAYAGSPLLDWVQVLLSADTPAEFHAVVREHPQLLDEGAAALLDALMGEAQQLGEREAAKAIHRTRQMLADLRASGEPAVASQVAAPPEPAASSPHDPAAEHTLSDIAYQTLLSTASSEDLLDAVREHPALLEPWAEAALIAQAEAALEAGGERIALLLDERIAALAEIRSALGAEAALLAAIRSLLAAESEEAIARAINDAPTLLTDAAQVALTQLSAEAHAAGDTQLSTYASECRAMLREVRRGLDAQI